MKLSTLFSTFVCVTLGVASSAKEYSYFDVKKLSESLVDGSAPADTILIDVREPSEYAAGFIPGAFNMPLKTQSFALCKSPRSLKRPWGSPSPVRTCTWSSTARAECGPEWLKNRESNVDMKTGDLSGILEGVEPV